MNGTNGMGLNSLTQAERELILALSIEDVETDPDDGAILSRRPNLARRDVRLADWAEFWGWRLLESRK